MADEQLKVNFVADTTQADRLQAALRGVDDRAERLGTRLAATDASLANVGKGASKSAQSMSDA